MKRSTKVFFDSDVVISSFLSNKGAAHVLLKNVTIECLITDISQKEILRVAKKLSLSQENLITHVKSHFKQTGLLEKPKLIKDKYRIYVSDENDAHVVHGAIKSKAKFILTYNNRHFNQEKIKNDLDILVMTPGKFLQYLRSRN